VYERRLKRNVIEMAEGRYKQIVEMVAAVKEQRGKMYRTEPKDIVPIEILEAVALLKAYRGYEGIDIDKKIDEYTDLMNYSAFIIERLQDLKISSTIIVSNDKPELKVVQGSKPGLLRAIPKCFGTYDKAKVECMSVTDGCIHIASCFYKTTSDKPAETFPDCFGKQTQDCVKEACKSYNDCRIRTREIQAESDYADKCNCGGVCYEDDCDCRRG
jgi:hypothetical protein